MQNHEGRTRLSPYLSPAAAWALSIGTSVGWGSLVVTANTYLAQAGPLGSVLGMLIGMLLMLLVSRNFFYMAMHYPQAGGIYTYTREVFGYDRAFLVFWFLSLTYIAMFWANATSLPLFARYFIGDTFRVVYLFSVFEYDVYLGEVILTMAAIFLITFLCIRSKTIAAHVMAVLALTFTAVIAICFAAAMFGFKGDADPLYIPDRSSISQIFRIAFISPWAFVGFENITHSVEEFNFRLDKLHRILVISVISTTALYIFVLLLSITAYPVDCASWLDYIRNLDRYSGIEGLPAFYAARHYMGSFGVILLMVALLALVMTSLIGNLRALSRLFYAAARDDIIPAQFARLNAKQIPSRAMMLVAGISILVPLVGRTAIGWIVDVTTLGATMLYAFVSAAAYKVARKESRRRESITGALGFCIMLVFGVYLLFPSLFSDATIETETYILFMVWTIAGFFYFRWIISRDHARRFGKAIIVWISLLALVVFMAMIWSSRMDEKITNETIYTVQSYFHGESDPASQSMSEDAFIDEQIQHIHVTNSINTLVVSGLFVLALGAMLINHLSMKKWETKAVKERDEARDVAYRDSLTGTKSKVAFAEYEKHMDELIERGDAGVFSVIVCDVNGLKHINDTQGHKAGDAYIRRASHLICETYKHSPVFRVGGDEFAVVLTGHDFEERDRLLREINEIIDGNIGSGGIVISLGMSDYTRGEDLSFHTVFQRADEHMYDRKRQLKEMGAVTRD